MGFSEVVVPFVIIHYSCILARPLPSAADYIGQHARGDTGQIWRTRIGLPRALGLANPGVNYPDSATLTSVNNRFTEQSLVCSLRRSECEDGIRMRVPHSHAKTSDL